MALEGTTGVSVALLGTHDPLASTLRNGPRGDVRGPFLHEQPPPPEEVHSPASSLPAIRTEEPG